jgi:integrase
MRQPVTNSEQNLATNLLTCPSGHLRSLRVPRIAAIYRDMWNFIADNKDEHVNHDTFKGQHKSAIRLAKVRAFEVYSLRHTFLTRLGESGCDVWTLARIAGHSNIKMSTRYVHPSENAVLNAFSRLGGHSEELALDEGKTEILATDGR